MSGLTPRGQPLTESLIQSKALEFANTLGIGDFTASQVWLSRWKKEASFGKELMVRQQVQT